MSRRFLNGSSTEVVSKASDYLWNVILIFACGTGIIYNPIEVYPDQEIW